MKAVRGWSHMEVALSQQCMWNSCPKWSVRHNPYLGILWPYRRFEFLTSFNALNFSTGFHNRIGYLLSLTSCWMQAFNPMNQKCCDCLVTWDRRADIFRIVLLSQGNAKKEEFGGVSVAAKLHWPLFSLEAERLSGWQITKKTPDSGMWDPGAGLELCYNWYRSGYREWKGRG